jgi:glycine/D-amino acid oxidase-like deaminating enzyme
VKHVDYIIVGCGLAGIAFCEVLLKHQKSFVVFDNGSTSSSTVAAGMYNPVILKRFTPVWKAAEQLKVAIPVYKELEDRLKIKLDYQFDLLRRFASIEEQNNWFDAADNPKLAPYLNLNLVQFKNDSIDAPFGYGIVNEAGRVDTQLLVASYQKYLEKHRLLMSESFEHSAMLHSPQGITYKDFSTKNVIFAEGYGIKQNPFFKDLPLNGTKGEVLTVKIRDLKLDKPIKSSVFIIPLGDDLYRVGATYSHKDKTNNPSKEGQEELLKKLKTFIKVPIEIIDHRAGVRPTVKDRRPLVGKHPELKNLYLLNGLGSRGVMIAPYVANQLFSYIENGKSLDPDIELSRFL